MAPGSYPDDPSFLVPEQCSNCEVYSWAPPPDLGAGRELCTGCGMVSYCTQACSKEHWAKVHRHHCGAIAGTVECPGSVHSSEDCFDCQQVSKAGVENLKTVDNPTYPCMFIDVLGGEVRGFEPPPRSLASPHPFPVAGLPGDRLETGVIIMFKLLLKMRVTGHKVVKMCPTEFNMLLQKMVGARVMLWIHRKTYPVTDTMHWLPRMLDLGDEEVEGINIKSRRKFEAEYVLSDDHFRLYDLFMLVHQCLDYLMGPLGHQKDFKDPVAMFPKLLKPLVVKAQNSTFLQVVDQVFDALITKVVPYLEVVRMVCGGSLEGKECALCKEEVTVQEVSQLKVRRGRVAVRFNTLNMGLVRCGRDMCQAMLDQVIFSCQEGSSSLRHPRGWTTVAGTQGC